MGRRLVRGLGVVLVALLVVSAVAVVTISWRPDLLKGQIERLASRQLQAQVRIDGPIRFGLGRVTTVEVGDVAVGAPEWAHAPNLATLGHLRLGLEVVAWLRDDRLVVTELALDRPALMLERDAEGRVNWPAPATERGSPAASPAAEIRALSIKEGTVAYRDAVADVTFDATLSTPAGDGKVDLDGTGTVRGQPLQAQLEAGLPASLAAGSEPLTLSGHLALGDSRVEGDLSYLAATPRSRLEGRLHAPLIDLVALALAPVVEGSGSGDGDVGASVSPLAMLDGQLDLTVDRLRLPQLELQQIKAPVVLENGRLVADGISVGLPAGQVSGRLALNDAGAGGFSGEAAMTATGVDLAALLPDRGIGGTLNGELSANLGGDDLPALLGRSRLDLTAEIAAPVLPQVGGSLSDLSLKAVVDPAAEPPVTIHAKSRLNDEPARVDVRGGSPAALLAQPIRYPLALDIDVGGTKARLDGTLAWPLTAGGLDMQVALDVRELDLTRLLGDGAAVGGVVTARADGRLEGGSLSEIVSGSHLKAEGKLAGLRLPQLEERLQSAEFALSLAPGSGRPLDARLTGRLVGQPLEVTANAGAIEQLARGGEADVPVEAHARLGETRIDAEGTVAWPLERQVLRLAMKAAGPDPALLAGPLGLPELTLPPYRLAAEIARGGPAWRFADLSGTIGDTDVRGDLRLELGGERPALSGKLHSQRLDLDDLLGLFGAEPGTGPGETASGQQRAEARRQAKDDQVLPEQRLDPESWRRLDLDLGLEAAKVEAGILPLDSFRMQVALQDGRLRAHPLELRLGDGRLEGDVSVDGRQRPAKAEMDAEITRVPVGQLLKRLGVDASSFGTLSGHIRGGAGIEGRGASVAEILGNADGALTLLMEGGRINRQMVDLLGFDFLNLFGSLLGTTPAELTLGCTLADLQVRDGLVSTRSLVVDTDAASLAGKGTVNLKNEALDIELLADPKGRPLLGGRTGVTIGGTLANPEISYDVATLAVRGAAAATFGVLLRPFTAVASAVLPGSATAERGKCRELLDRVPEPAAGG